VDFSPNTIKMLLLWPRKASPNLPHLRRRSLPRRPNSHGQKVRWHHIAATRKSQYICVLSNQYFRRLNFPQASSPCSSLYYTKRLFKTTLFEVALEKISNCANAAAAAAAAQLPWNILAAKLPSYGTGFE
jgi:hypothetical protein